MQELIQKVSEKAGINAEQAKNAVNTVMDVIKNKVPGVGDKIKELIAGGGGDAGGIVDSIRKKIGV
jgi:nucleoid DNA-binding protein